MQSLALNSRYRFLAAATLATFSFLFGALAIRIFSINEKFLFYALTLTGAHQVTTLYYYWDQSSLHSMARRVKDFFTIPLIIILLTTSFFFFLPSNLRVYFLLVYGSITVWHYQKQNLGFFALSTTALQQKPITSLERGALLLAGAAPTVSFLYGPNLSEGFIYRTFLGNQISFLTWLNFTLFFSAIVLALVASIKNSDMAFKSRVLRGVYLLLFTSFFWPTIWIHDPYLAFAIYGGSHGIQYFLITGLISIGSDKGVQASRSRQILGLGIALFSTFGVFALWRSFSLFNHPLGSLNADQVKNLFLGFSLSISFCHYFVDARLWKMRHPDARQFLTTRLSFLFPKSFSGTQLPDWSSFSKQIQIFRWVYGMIAVVVLSFALGNWFL